MENLNKFNKLFVILLMGIFLISFASAVQFNNHKSYDEGSKTVTIKESYLGDVIANVTLNTPLINLVPYGSYEKVFEFEINNYRGLAYKDVFDKWEFFHAKDMKETWRDIDLKYKVIALENVTDYNTICTDDDDSETCTTSIEGYHTEEKEVWYKLNPSDIMKGQKLIIGGFTYVNEGDSIEWIPTMFGVEVDEWAQWDSSLDTGAIVYLALNETTGNVINFFGSDATNFGATRGVTGKISNAFTLEEANSDYINLSQYHDLSDFTLNFWAYPGDDWSVQQHIVSGRDLTDRDRFQILAGGGLRFQIDTSNYDITGNPFTSVHGNYEMYTIMREGSNCSIFVNGTFFDNVACGTDTMSINNFGNRAWAATGIQFFNGTVDEIGLWNRSLSQAEINNLTALRVPFGGGAPTSSLTTTLISPTNATNQSSTTPTLTSTVVISDGGIEVENVTYWYDDSAETTNSSGDNGTYIFTPTITDGDWHTWKVVAFGNDSVQYNSSELRYIAFWNNATLTLPLNSPANATNQSSSSPIVNWSAVVSDGYLGLENTTLWLDDVAVSTNSSGTLGVYLDQLSLSDGDWHIWRVSGYDNKSRLVNSTEERYIAFWNNITFIDVTLNSPANGGIFTISQVFNATGTSNTLLSNASWYSNSTGVWKLNETITGFSGEILANNNINYGGVVADTTQAGVLIRIGNTDIILTNITRYGGGSDEMTNATLFHLNGTVIDTTTTLSGDTFTFATNHTLEANQYYRIEGDQVGTYNRYKNTTALSLPISSVSFEWIAGSATGSTNLTSLWNIQSIGITASIKISDILFTKTLNSTTIWNVEFCTIENECNQSIANFTVTKDTGSPQIVIESPNGTEDYFLIGSNETLNVTVSDSNIDNCWYNYNGINTTIPSCINGVKNSIPFEFVGGSNTITVYANDTIGNLNSSSTSWTYILTEINQTFNNLSVEGFLETFTARIIVDPSYTLTEGIFSYNGTNYTTSILFSGGQNLLVSSIVLPLVDTSQLFNFTFFAVISGQIYNLQTYQQNVTSLNISECEIGGELLINISLYDEGTKDSIFGDIEVNAQAISKTSGEVVVTVNANFINETYGALCLTPSQAFSGLYFASEIRYSADNHVAEFYYIQQADMTDYPINLSLFDLASNDSTEFLVKYQDDSLITVEGAIIQLMRKYISEDQYEIVEAPLTSTGGTAVLHIDLNTNKYRASVVKDGVLLDFFDNIVFDCENELSGQCNYLLLGNIDPQNDVPIIQLKDFAYSVSSVNNTVTTLFAIPSGTPSTVNILLTQVDQFGNKTSCNQTIISSAGSVDCNFVDTIGESFLVLEISKDDLLQAQQSYVVVNNDNLDWLDNNYFIVIILMLSVIGMAFSSPEFIILNAVVVMLLGGAFWLLNGVNFVMGLGVLVWLVIGAGILINKLTSQEDK